MNKYSVICNFIQDNKNWRELLDAKHVAVKESGDLAIFNYGIECDFADPVVQEARGIIINLKTLEVVCWPFRKFGNYGESYIDKIDWNSARVQEKVDGSIVKLWYNRLIDKWQWSTNGVIDASEARTLFGAISFLDLIKSADNYNDIPFDALDKDKTYVFEMVAPEQQIIVRYEYPMLYHTGTRSNITGEEFDENIGIKKPMTYPLHSLDDCIKAAEELNKDQNNIQYEGFVVVDADWHRIKIKSPSYVYAHYLAENRNYSMKRLMPMVIEGNSSLEELMALAPDSELYVRYYQYQYALFKRNVKISIAKARAIYEEFSHDRKAVVTAIQNDKYKFFAFKALGNERSAEEIIDGTPVSGIIKWIPEFSE